MHNIILSIPEPCHENWDNMSPTQQGRFCKACVKEVVDFSQMSDQEVLNYFINTKSANTCGRVYPDQLERTISEAMPVKRRKFWYWHYVAMFFVFFSKSAVVKAQGSLKLKGKMKPSTQHENDVTRIITGTIKDSNGKGIAFANINIAKLSRGVTADANGNYAIKVEKGQSILLSSKGYFTKTILIADDDHITTILDRNSIDEPKQRVVAMAGGISYRRVESPKAMIPAKMVITVKDKSTGTIISNATVIIKNYGTITPDIRVDQNGVFDKTNINTGDQYTIEASAVGYLTRSLVISGEKIKGNEPVKEIYLQKVIQNTIAKNTAPVTDSAIAKKNGKDTKIRMGSVHRLPVDESALYVVDGIIIPGIQNTTIEPDNIADLTILQKEAAIKRFGEKGKNGAIMITTKNKEYKCLEEVKITSYGINRSLKGMAGAMSVVYSSKLQQKPAITDTIKNFFLKPAAQVKAYPNPVSRGNTVSLAFSLKLSGNYLVHIINSVGMVMQQKHMITDLKTVKENILIDSRWSSGIYYVRVFDETNKPVANSSFIVQ